MSQHAESLRIIKKALAALADAQAPQPHQAFEEALVRKYLHASGQAQSSAINRDLGRITADTSPVATLGDQHATQLPTPTTVEDLLTLFELLNNAADTTTSGMVFTPQWLAHYLVTQAITPQQRNSPVLDPAVGSGALLIAALRHLHKTHHGLRPASEIISTQLYGTDVNEAGVRQTKLLLTITAAIELGDDQPAYDFNIEVKDALDKQNWDPTYTQKFGAIIANPPYVRYQELTPNQRTQYATQWHTLTHGNYNLYYAFFELAQLLRNPTGTIAFITPNTYFHTAAARPLRNWMTENNYPTRIINFGQTQIFPTATTYVAITISNPADTDLSYTEVTDADQLQTLTPDTYTNIPHQNLGTGPWHLTTKQHYENIQLLTQAGQPLHTLANITYGLATLRDSLYLLPPDRTTKTGHQIEPGATRPVVKVSNVQTQHQLDTADTHIIFPYTHTTTGKAEIWTPDELAKYPNTEKYLLAIREELARRDHGKKQYPAWYAYGRTQGLQLPATPRLLSPLYGNKPRFLVDNNPERLFVNGIAITPKPDSGITAELLHIILNSALFHYYITKVTPQIRGGYHTYQKTPIGNFHIPQALITNPDTLLNTPPGEREGHLRAHFRL